jgi:hypothetical protein
MLACIKDTTFVLINAEIDGMCVLMNDLNDFKIHCRVFALLRYV